LDVANDAIAINDDIVASVIDLGGEDFGISDPVVTGRLKTSHEWALQNQPVLVDE